MMTLEEAIKAEEAETLAYEECINSLDDNMPTDMWNELNKSLGKQMDYHRQLAEWLRELKYYKDRQDLINKSWQELINYKEGIEIIKMRSQAYRECGENILASGMEQALDILTEVNADE